MKSWYDIKNKTNDVLNISIHDEIGMFGISASEFIGDLRRNESVKSINLSIHSPGGSVLDGLAIYNALKSHPAKVYGHVEAIAASAASFILMAADVISMPKDAFIMIHNAQGGAMGEADDLRDMADIMDKLQNSIINIYENRTGLERAELTEMLKAETWMNADEALMHGFTDTITDAINVAAKIGVFNKYFKSMPIQNSNDIEGIKTFEDFENYLTSSCNCSRRLAKALCNRAESLSVLNSVDHSGEDLSKLSDGLSRLVSRLSA
jgi:ATP-dependent Clp protease protease subunit